MPSPKEETWKIDPHTQAKHAILQKYLEAWFPILTSKHNRVLIIDGFAGPGEYQGGELGSPLIALNVVRSHNHEVKSSQIEFFFIEVDTARCTHLRNLLRTIALPPHTTYEVFEGKFDEMMQTLLDDFNQPERVNAPMFVFIDPFGFSHTPMSLIASLMQRPRCEVLITFMYEEINRFYEHPSPTIQAEYDQLFGSAAWRSIGKVREPKERLKQTQDLYRHQLQTIGHTQYVRSFRMVNKNNATDYLLFFGTNSLFGMEKMKDAMWVVDRSGAFVFSDVTNPNQPLLFEIQPDLDQLSRLIVNQFVGMLTTVQQVEDFVIGETPFRKAHYKGVLKDLEYSNKITVLGRKGPKGTFADPDIKLQFSGLIAPTLF
jgi:three-Cys-motif partner protein